MILKLGQSTKLIVDKMLDPGHLRTQRQQFINYKFEAFFKTCSSVQHTSIEIPKVLHNLSTNVN